MAHSVAQRTREFGIRMAPGAHWRDVIQLVIWNALPLIGTGLVIGLGAALPAVVAVLATLIPARRAVRVDPTIALRYE